MSTSKIRLEKSNTLPKMSACDDDLIFNLTTKHLHYRVEGARYWKRLKPLGTANSPQDVSPGDCYMGKGSVYICYEKSAAYIFTKEDWDLKGLPLPGGIKEGSMNKLAIPLESLRLLEDDFKVPSEIQGVLGNIVFDGLNGILAYKPSRGRSWYRIKCFNTVMMRGMPTIPGNYVVMKETVYICGVNTVFFMELSEFQEALAEVSAELFIPETNKVEGNLDQLVRNSSAIIPSDAHVYDRETGQSYYVHNVLLIYKPDYLDNEVIITTEGVVAIPKGFKITQSYMNTQAERLLKVAPDAHLTDTTDEEVSPRSVISDDIIGPIVQIPNDDQQPSPELLKAMMDRLTALEDCVAKLTRQDEQRSSPEVLVMEEDTTSEAVTVETVNPDVHEKEEKLSDKLARARSFTDDRSDRYVRMIQFIELIEDNPRATTKALRVKMGLTVHIITDLLSKLRACGALVNIGNRMSPQWVVYREKFFEANPIDEYIY